MPRKAVHLMPAGALTVVDQIWSALRLLQAGNVRQIAYEAKAGRDTTRQYLARLLRAGIVAKAEGSCGAVYSLQRDPGVEAPRLRDDGTACTQGHGREAMWRTMRVLKEFGTSDLVAHARAADITVAESEARNYCLWLARAGYLARLTTQTATPRWRLVPTRYTGPKPPMIQRIRQVYDPNLGKVVWCGKPDTEEASA